MSKDQINTAPETVTPVKEQIKDVDLKKVTTDHTTTSARIRALNGMGYNRSQIAKGLGKRYQHVRNVLITPLKGQ